MSQVCGAPEATEETKSSFHVCDFNVIKPKPDYQSCVSEAAHSRHASEFIANNPHAINNS